MNKEQIKSAFLGHAIGDALGVPVEFESREYLKQNPVKDYLGYLCWDQPPGTFSDDSSMMFCTAESLCLGFDIDDMANKFVDWYKNGYWGAHYELFDIGGTTLRSLNRIFYGENPKYSGESLPNSNGNGSLMRILPLIFFLTKERNIQKRFEIVKAVSSITHAHFRSVLSCFIFVEFGIELLENDKQYSFEKTLNNIKLFTNKMQFSKEELKHFSNILDSRILDMKEYEISSKGYVIDSLESSIWCFMNSNSYTESVLKSVNLGGDTDTTAAINGGLAGLYYGIEDIPKKWINELARVDDIIELADKFEQSL